MASTISRRRVIWTAMLAPLAGCDTTGGDQGGSASARLARPERVIVPLFTALAQDAMHDQGPGSRIARAVEQEPLNDAELRAARAAQAAMQAALVQALRARGLAAEAGRPDAATGPALMVQGQMVSVVSGNRTQRMPIAYGAGQSAITAEVQVLYVAGVQAPQFLESFAAQSAPAPEGGAASPASGPTSGAAARGSAADPRRLAEAIADRIGGFAASQGWIAPRR